MNAILSRVFWEKTQVFCDSSVCWGFYLRFFLLQNAIHEETQVDLSLFSSRIFFVRIFKTRLEYGFLSGFFALFLLFSLYSRATACSEYFIRGSPPPPPPKRSVSCCCSHPSYPLCPLPVCHVSCFRAHTAPFPCSVAPLPLLPFYCPPPPLNI